MKEIQQTVNKLEELLNKSNELTKQYNEQKDLSEKEQDKDLMKDLKNQLDNLINREEQKQIILELRLQADNQNKYSVLYHNLLDSLDREFYTVTGTYNKNEFSTLLKLLKMIK